jgi:hypothetical protein
VRSQCKSTEARWLAVVSCASWVSTAKPCPSPCVEIRTTRPVAAIAIPGICPEAGKRISRSSVVLNGGATVLITNSPFALMSRVKPPSLCVSSLRNLNSTARCRRYRGATLFSSKGFKFHPILGRSLPSRDSALMLNRLKIQGLAIAPSDIQTISKKNLASW